MGIDEEERYQDDPLAVAGDIYITGIRIRNTPAPLDRNYMEHTQTKEKQRVLLFPVVKSALKARGVVTPATGVLGVRISLILTSGFNANQGCPKGQIGLAGTRRGGCQRRDVRVTTL